MNELLKKMDSYLFSMKMLNYRGIVVNEMLFHER